jgi:hypothetical protein
MGSGTNTQIRRKIHQSEFNKLIVEHETFLLHFLVEDQVDHIPTTFISFFDIQKRKEMNDAESDSFEVLMGYLNLPYFELLTKDAVDLMVDLGYSTNWIITENPGGVVIENTEGKPNIGYRPLMMIIHKGKVFYNTLFDCYCHETILENLVKLNPNLVFNPD